MSERGKLTLPKQEPGAPAADAAKSTGDDAALSIALLQLVYRHDKEPEYLVSRAKELKRLWLAPES